MSTWQYQAPTAPGWYADPYDSRQLRYWDGRAWTSHTNAGQLIGGFSAQALPPAATKNSNGTAIGIGVAAAVGGLLIGAIAMAGPTDSVVAVEQPTQEQWAQPSQPAPSEEQSALDPMRTAHDATVVVHQRTSSTEYFVGAAVAIDETTFLTADHVVEESDRAEIVLQDGTTLEGYVIKRDEMRDLALVETEPHGLPVAPIASTNPVVGDQVFAFGAPNDYVQTSQGFVTDVYDPDGDGVEDVETDTAIRHGNSGGPLVDTSGEVVGIVTFITEKGGRYGYATSSTEIWAFLDSDAGWTDAAY